MSRSITGLRCRVWWGDWAAMFRRENKELREFGRRKRRRAQEREWRTEAALWNSRQDRAEQRAFAMFLREQEDD